MSKEEIIKYWISASEEDFDLSRTLFQNKKFVYSLFFVHLSIEKLLKGLIVMIRDRFMTASCFRDAQRATDVPLLVSADCSAQAVESA